MTTEEFIKKAEQIHEKVDYSKVDYSSMRSPVNLKCLTHQMWYKQQPFNHLRGKTSGCPKCKGDAIAKSKTQNTDIFVGKATAVHKDLYDYKKVVYVNANKKVVIGCPKHGDFEQCPFNHLQGCGCPRCAIEKTTCATRLTCSQFIQKGNRVHNNAYHYKNVYYINYTTPVMITCDIHGDFALTPDYHISKAMGCPKCRKNKRRGGLYRKTFDWSGVNNTKGILYVLVISDTSESFCKVGISRQQRNNRISQLKWHIPNNYSVDVMGIFNFSNIYDAWVCEEEMLNVYPRYIPNFLFPGHTECIRVSDIQCLLSEIEAFTQQLEI